MYIFKKLISSDNIFNLAAKSNFCCWHFYGLVTVFFSFFFWKIKAHYLTCYYSSATWRLSVFVLRNNTISIYDVKRQPIILKFYKILTFWGWFRTNKSHDTTHIIDTKDVVWTKLFLKHVLEFIFGFSKKKIFFFWWL